MVLSKDEVSAMQKDLATYRYSLNIHNNATLQTTSQFDRLTHDYKALMSEYEECKEARDKYKRQCRPETATPFVLALIDGDNYTFEHKYFEKPDGGHHAAEQLFAALMEQIRNLGLPVDTKIVVKYLINMANASSELHRLGVVGSHSRALATFAVSFSKPYPLFEYIDCGEHKATTSLKIQENFELFAGNPSCRHVFFAACNNETNLGVLYPYERNSGHVTLIRTTESFTQYLTLGLRAFELKGIFCDKKPPAIVPRAFPLDTNRRHPSGPGPRGHDEVKGHVPKRNGWSDSTSQSSAQRSGPAIKGNDAARGPWPSHKPGHKYARNMSTWQRPPKQTETPPARTPSPDDAEPLIPLSINSLSDGPGPKEEKSPQTTAEQQKSVWPSRVSPAYAAYRPGNDNSEDDKENDRPVGEVGIHYGQDGFRRHCVANVWNSDHNRYGGSYTMQASAMNDPRMYDEVPLLGDEITPAPTAAITKINTSPARSKTPTDKSPPPSPLGSQPFDRSTGSFATASNAAAVTAEKSHQSDKGDDNSTGPTTPATTVRASSAVSRSTSMHTGSSDEDHVNKSIDIDGHGPMHRPGGLAGSRHAVSQAELDQSSQTSHLRPPSPVGIKPYRSPRQPPVDSYRQPFAHAAQMRSTEPAHPGSPMSSTVYNSAPVRMRQVDTIQVGPGGKLIITPGETKQLQGPDKWLNAKDESSGLRAGAAEFVPGPGGQDENSKAGQNVLELV